MRPDRKRPPASDHGAEKREGTPQKAGIAAADMSGPALRAAQEIREHFPELQPADIEDAVCEAQVRTLERIDFDRLRTGPDTYLRAVALRIAKRLANPRSTPLSAAAAARISAPDFADRAIASIDLKREIADPQTLLSGEAEAWQLKALVGLSAGEISKRTGCCKETVYRRVRAATEKLIVASVASEVSGPDDGGPTP